MNQHGLWVKAKHGGVHMEAPLWVSFFPLGATIELGLGKGHSSCDGPDSCLLQEMAWEFTVGMLIISDENQI